jgi:Fur family ferric uptake transcriptional regulator
MTLAPDAAPLDCQTLEEAVAALRERGLRLSAVRRLVLETLFDEDVPMSAEQIAQRRRLDPSSVYRNLEALEAQGLLRHVHLGHGPGLYAPRGRGEREYLYCECCGAVQALAPAELDPIRAYVRAQFRHEARFTHFPIAGLCRDCARQAADPPAGQ